MPNRRAEEVSAAVSAVAPAASSSVPEWRWWRWVVQLGDDIAFVADDDEGWGRLEREGVLLSRLEGRGRLTVPRVIGRDPERRVQVRRKVRGVQGFAVEELVFGRAGKLGGAERYGDRLVITARGERLATELGRAIQELQQAVPAAEARALGFPETSYVAVLDQVAEWLAGRSDLAEVSGAVPALRAWFAGVPDEPALAVRDLQMHNVAVDPSTGALLALFDFDDAGVAHRLEDFKYLPSFGRRFTNLALAAYADAGGAALSLADVWRFHALSALEHFLFVPEGSERWREIVAWSTESLRQLG
jgi:hypothetical protein